MKGSWEFNHAIADVFDEIARREIPNYERVIEKSVDLALSAFPAKNARVIDVGSATGYTMHKLKQAGFTEVFGVDNSPHMLKRSRVQENLIHSHTFPKEHGPFDVTIANWTLHFIEKREEYIRDVFDAMREGGMLVLTDKVQTTSRVHGHYHEFKRRNGVSDKAIRAKAEAIKGVLVPYPLEWYLHTLRAVGFGDVEIIDAHWCFVTFVCSK